MAIEIILKEYFIIERETKTDHDSPAIGIYQEYEVGKNEYGPYQTPDEANSALSNLRAEKEKQGWIMRGNGNLSRHNYQDIYYSIVPKTKTVFPNEEIKKILTSEEIKNVLTRILGL